MKKNSTEHSSWLSQKMDEALAAPNSRVCEPPPPPYPSSPEAGADDLLEILAVIESFGVPKPSREKIIYTKLLL